MKPKSAAQNLARLCINQTPVEDLWVLAGGEEVKRSPAAIVDAARRRKRRYETQGLGSQGLAVCLDTKRKEMPADRLRWRRTYLKASFTSAA